MTQSGSDRETGGRSFSNSIEALASHRRRRVLYYLLDTDDGLVPTDDLVDHVLEHDPKADDRDEITLSLHHVHLPKLSDAGLIEYDTQGGTVRYRESTMVEGLLDALRELEANG